MDKLKLLLTYFLFSPIIGLIQSLKYFGSKESKILLYVFFIYYGFTLNVETGADSSRHVQRLLHYENLPLKNWLEELWLMIQLNPSKETNDEPYLHIISYIAGNITTTHHALYSIASLIYGWLFVNSIYAVESLIKTDKSRIILILFVFFFFWKSFEGINSIRNWTGAWCLFYGTFQYYNTRKKSYLIFIFISPLIHFGYALMSIPIFIVLIFGNRPIIYCFVFIISFFYHPSPTTISNIGGKTELSQQKLKTYYRDDEKIALKEEVFNENSSFHRKYAEPLGRLYLKFLLFYIIFLFGYLWRRNLTDSEVFAHSFISIAVLMYAASNITQYYSSLSIRLELNGGLYALLAILLLLTQKLISKNPREYPLILRIFYFTSFPIVGFFIFMKLSYCLEYLNIKMLVSPIFEIFFHELNISVKELIKMIF